MRCATTCTARQNAAKRPRRAVRVVALSLFVCLIACGMAFVPLSVNVSPVTSDVKLQKCKAFGVASPVSDASALIEILANSAGLTSSEFVVTSGNAIAIGAGMLVAKDAGWDAGASLSANLENLIDAADYPNWDTLSNEQQTSWGSKANYDAAKYNSLLSAFGYGETVSDYYATGGGNFEPDDDVKDRLEQFGRIGRLWLDGAGVTFEQVKGLFVSSYVSDLNNWYGGRVVTAYGSGLEDWPVEIPDPISMGEGVLFSYINGTYKIYRISNSPVYWVNFVHKANSSNVVTLTSFLFSKSPFAFANNSGVDVQIPETTDTVSHAVDTEYGTYYRGSKSQHNLFYGSNLGWDAAAYCNMPVYTYNDGVTRNFEWFNTRMEVIEPYILFGASLSNNIEEVTDYPGVSQIEDGTVTYLPEDGVNPINNWYYYITQPENPHVPEPVERPDNPYNPVNPDNPQYQSGTPEWKQDTTENLKPALDIQFNKLFPFCVVYDLKLYWDKLKAITGYSHEDGTLSIQARNQYELITIPGIDSAGLESGITFNLEPVARILRYVRPAVFWLLVVKLVMSVIDFWRNILTGA